MAPEQLLNSPNRRAELRRQVTPLFLGLVILAGMSLAALAIGLVLFR